MKKVYQDLTIDEERALYRSRGLVIENCRFDGTDDNEDILMESTDITVKDSYFNLCYPLWYSSLINISHSEITEDCRSPIWYSEKVNVSDSKLHGPKAFRECSGISIKGCDIVSTEFGWNVQGIDMKDCRAEGEYFLLRSDHISFDHVSFCGKYSFQYIRDAVFSNCEFDSKDAFWHAENVKLENCLLNGKYLAWSSESVCLENCTIIGEMPFCRCKNLRLVNCRMEDTELAFEKSEVQADITTVVKSIMNPKSGLIRAAGAEKIIMGDPEAKAEIVIV